MATAAQHRAAFERRFKTFDEMDVHFTNTPAPGGRIASPQRTRAGFAARKITPWTPPADAVRCATSPAPPAQPLNEGLGTISCTQLQAIQAGRKAPALRTMTADGIVETPVRGEG